MKHFNFTLILLAALIVTIATCCDNTHRRAAKKQQTEQAIDTVDTIYMTPEESVNLMLDIRKDMIDSKHIDSVYITMPEDAIITIVLKNPDCDISHVVKEYETNRSYYDDLLERKQKIEKYKKLKEPDTIPTQAKTDSMNSKPMIN